MTVVRRIRVGVKYSWALDSGHKEDIKVEVLG
jgi:hypothetical protein